MKNFRILFLLIALWGLQTALAQDLSGVKIHINPGHGGWDSDDRGVPTPLFPKVGPNLGFWESQSNLDKGLQLRDMLLALGANVQISRTQNRTEDDLRLSVIVRMANEFQADFMLSIHSNAGQGVANYVLMLFAGKSDGDTHIYPTPTPRSDESKAISTEIAKNLIKNRLNNWSTPHYNVSGDKTFARLQMGWNDGYGVLRGLTVPGVISEGSMHDYIPEAYRLMNMEYKWLEAWNFKKAFCTYFKNAEIPTGNIAGWVKDNSLKITDGQYIKYGKDILLPIDGAKVSLVETGASYTVDNNRNGVYVFKDLQPGTYTIRVEAQGYHTQEQSVKVTKNEISYQNIELVKIRNTPPQVTAYSPKVAENETVECSSDIVLDFNWDMDEESTSAAFSISPQREGKITFDNNAKRLRFKPRIPFEKSTRYTVTLKRTAKHPDNMSMENDFSFSFTTKDRNRLALLAGFPNNEYKVMQASNPAFYFIFDGKLGSTNMLQQNIQVFDSENKELEKAPMSIRKNKIRKGGYGDVYFETSNPLEAGKKYKVVLGSDVVDNIGMPLVDPIEIHFTASTIQVNDKNVVEDFEGKAGFVYEAAQSRNTQSALSEKSSSERLFGSSSNMLKATFSQQDAFAVYKVSTPSVSSTKGRAFGLHVYGDMSNNELQLELTQGATVKYLSLCKLSFWGWQFVEAKIEEAGDYTLSGIRILRKEGVISGKSTIYIDNLLQYDNLISSWNSPSFEREELALLLYPNPTQKMVFVRSESEEKPVLQLYSIDGSLLKTVLSKEMDISEFPSGSYLMKIAFRNRTFARPVLLSK